MQTLMKLCRRTPCRSVFAACACLCLCLPAGAHRRHRVHHAAPTDIPIYSWETGKPDLSPISVQAYTPAPADARQANFLKRMNLENGLEVKGTHWIEQKDVRSRDLFILSITQSLEGGFDSVNVYDKGILSWGIMQWAARSGSLDQCLIFIKRKLLAGGQKTLWQKTFVDNGIDVDYGGLILYGRRMPTPADRRVALRGTMKVGFYDNALASRWATVFARAGRQPAVEELQVEYAAGIVDDVLNKRLAAAPFHSPGRHGVTANDLAGNDPYADALIFALWTNNPRNAESYIDQAAVAARSASHTDDPVLWAPGAFSRSLLDACAKSHFGNWPAREALIEQREAAVQTGSSTDLTPFEKQYLKVLSARKQIRALEVAQRRRLNRSADTATRSNQVASAPVVTAGDQGEKGATAKGAPSAIAPATP